MRYEDLDLSTRRLHIRAMDADDAGFILALLNSPGWKTFIGNSKVQTEAQAGAYIQAIADDPQIHYWTVRQKADKSETHGAALGIITFIKKAHLDHPDFGFAFLPEHEGFGYAEEASKAVLECLLESPQPSTLLAVTKPENDRSIKLLNRLGFAFERPMESKGEPLHVYAVSRDVLQIGLLCHRFFDAFTNAHGRTADLEQLRVLCIPEVQIYAKTDPSPAAEASMDKAITPAPSDYKASSLEAFITPRQRMLNDGTLTEFWERETSVENKVKGNIAQRCSAYRKEGVLNGERFAQEGVKLFQLLRSKTGWRIASVLWEDALIPSTPSA